MDLGCQVISQRLFSKRQLPKGIFPSDNFPTVQFTKRQLPKSVIAAATWHTRLFQPQHLAHQPVLAAAPGTLDCPSRSTWHNRLSQPQHLAHQPVVAPHFSLRRLRRSNQANLREVATWENTLYRIWICNPFRSF